ncbi:MAG: nickel-dependent lactate racemase [Anaerolineaceae bacterium]|nr:nickel-dependent lactate racemase [Anaerolineaceae bacterium]
MKKYSLKYGETSQDIMIDDQQYDIDVIEPNYVHPDSETISDRIVAQLSHPIGQFQWNTSLTKNPDTKIAIAINDKTRPVPHALLLPPLLNYLLELGFNKEQIIFYIATGTHLPMPSIEFTKIVPENIIQQYKIISHDCDDEDDLQYIGNTSRKSPVWVNKAFYEADLKFVIGNIEPHHFMGFSGGYKSASIGLTGRKTINKNHSLITSPSAKVGIYDENPMRQDVEEIGQMIGIDAALNIILNTEREIVHVLFGSPLSMMEKGVALCRKVYETSIDKKYDLVIASVGGYPKDINFYQAQKALTHASLITKENGTVILCGECREGSGSASFEKFVEQTTSYQDALTQFLSSPFQIGPHKAYQVAKLLEHIKVELVSALPYPLANKLHLQSSTNLQDVFNRIESSLPNAATIAILPKAINTIPKFME